MSRIGKKPVAVPSAVTATVSGQTVKMKGAKGELSFTCPEQIKIEKTADGIEVTPRDETKAARSMWGMSRTMIQNMIKGVTEGYSHTLEIHGVGFKASMKGKDVLTLAVGYGRFESVVTCSRGLVARQRRALSPRALRADRWSAA